MSVGSSSSVGVWLGNWFVEVAGEVLVVMLGDCIKLCFRCGKFVEKDKGFEDVRVW